MEKVTIPKERFERLLLIEEAYTKLSKIVLDSYTENLIAPIIKDFEDTGLYSKEFINDLREGLSKSTYSNSTDKLPTRVADE